MDKETGLLKLNRILCTSTHYPADYGFIPLTYVNPKDIERYAEKFADKRAAAEGASAAHGL